MAISTKLEAFIKASGVKYTVAKHPVVYTAQEIAAAGHIPGRQLAKSVLVKTDRGFALAVLPAIHLINLKKLRSILGAKSLSIAKESDIKSQFPDVEVGAMSPFGNLYEVPVVADTFLRDSEDITFNAGSHTDTITLRYSDFVSLVKPKTVNFGEPIGGPAPKKKAVQPKRAKKSTRKRTSRSRPKKRSP